MNFQSLKPSSERSNFLVEPKLEVRPLGETKSTETWPLIVVSMFKFRRMCSKFLNPSIKSAVISKSCSYASPVVTETFGSTTSQRFSICSLTFSQVSAISTIL
ncbi:hypothetical protein WICPIJ_007999 [Wickerhamomyces pijperi]|uniref:Uncharacterized protein n=1 Tax=Wickerhamomyces pijperi TaxID=599730 RepID=A0A9P8TJV4_WICPI|nr:hypothetical protein WICPIJ_007999 [Wickerhamomyces pijperi]